MEWWQRLKNLLRAPAPSQGKFFTVAVRCAACQEVIQTQIHLGNDLSEEDESANATTYRCRKVLLGRKRCYRPIEVVLLFDAQRRLLSREVSGGEFVETPTL